MRARLAHLNAEEFHEVNDMENTERQLLHGQTAQILLKDGTQYEVIFGHDVQLQWVSGRNLDTPVPPALHPAISGHLDTTEDYSHVKDAELILADKKVLKISFIDPQYFTAHQSINSRQEVYET